MPDNFAVFAAVIVLLPMMYFLLAAPAFLLVGLDIPPVTVLLRGMFSSYLLALEVAGIIGTMAVMIGGRPLLALVVGCIAALAHVSRRWFWRQIDAGIRERDAGDASAVRRLRRLHVGGMLGNAVLLVALIASIPYVAVVPATSGVSRAATPGGA